eukprot:XP_011513349.1 uncharacterized protein LOC105375106 [Homo sapiens]
MVRWAPGLIESSLETALFGSSTHLSALCVHLFNTRGLAQLSLLKECSLTYYVAGTGLVAGQSKLILIILLEKELLVEGPKKNQLPCRRVCRICRLPSSGSPGPPGVGTRKWKARLTRLSSLAASRWLPGSLASPLAPSPDAGLLRFGREAARRGAVPAAATAAPHSVSPGGATYAGDPALGHRRPASHRCGGRLSRGEEETQEEEEKEKEEKEEGRSCPRPAGARQEREENLLPPPRAALPALSHAFRFHLGL